MPHVRNDHGKILQTVSLVLLTIATLYLPAHAQDSNNVNQHLDAAKQIAGTEWATAAQFLCSPADEVEDRLPPVQRKESDALREPMKVFDNLYFIGEKADANWVITTSEGMILIDSGPAETVESILMAGLKKLSLDPSKIKYVLIAHEHADHYGGSKYLQDHYPDLHIAMSEQAWQALERTTGRSGAQQAPPPKRDMVLVEGSPVTLADIQVNPVYIPGHTQGSMGFIFPVRDGQTTHVIGLFGSTMLSAPKRASISQLRQYVASIDHWADITRNSGVDVELPNHPIFDGLFTKFERLKTRKAGDPHPLVVGETAYQRYVGVLSECMKAQIGRRE